MKNTIKKASLVVVAVITLSVFSTSLVLAQSSDFYEKLKFGVKGGLNVTSMNDEDRVPDAKVTPRIGFHLGVLAHYDWNDKWAIQPEVVYSKEGAKYDFPGSPEIPFEYRGKTDINLINIPILVQYKIGSQFRIQTGPQTGLIINANFEDANDKNNESRKLDIQRVNLTWAIGFGYLTKSGLGFDARYNVGITNIYPDEVYPGQSLRTRAGQFGIFYQFK
ncbi:porin family protein [Rufibacter roseus]|uniref:Porin family protein n=1 Tax=Rufibacter roseus TaxID=1567108 RepID=A0ABW2DTH5_9BACT|nr:porin family protein [Rufibacter roseus]